MTIFFLAKISAYSETQTTPYTNISSTTEDDHDCCNGTCPIASISVDIYNGTLLNLVCITCTNIFYSFVVT